MKKSVLTVFLLLAAISSYAVTKKIEIDTSIINSQFFTAILAGVLLALIFQIILTALSVALGINMIGDLKKAYVEHKVRALENEKEDEDHFSQDHSHYEAPTGVKISTAFGIWSAVTTALSLFGASAIALNLSFYGSTASNLTVGLVIWALFFLILFYLETRIVNTVVGGLVTTATSGLKTSANSIKLLFSTSDEKKIETVIGSSIEKIRKEFDISLNTSDLSKVLDKFFTKIEDKVPNYDTLKDDLEKIVGDSKSKNTAGKYMAIQQVLTKAIDKVGASNKQDSEDKIGKLKSVLSELKKAYNDDGSTVDGVKNVITKNTPLEDSQIDEVITQVQTYLSKITPEAFSGDKLSEDFHKILSAPKTAGAIFASKFNTINKESIIKILSENSSINENKLENYADEIEKSIAKVKKTIAENDINSITERAEHTLANFFNSTHREELNYADLKHDLNAILDHPKDSIAIIKSRLNRMDANTIKALVTNNKYINESQIDTVTSQITTIVETIKSKVAKIERKAHEQLEITKRKAVIQAEHARKTAASAAWWLVITVVFSAGAAMLGAWIELV